MALAGHPGYKALTSQPIVLLYALTLKGFWGSPKVKIHYLLHSSTIAILSW